MKGIARWSGLSIGIVEQNDGLIDESAFVMNLLPRPSDRLLRCTHDRRLSSAHTIDEYEDPSCRDSGIYTGAIEAYLRSELNCDGKWPRYEIDTPHPWNWNCHGYPNTMGDLRKALILNPEMRIFAACGYFDLVTPFAATECCFQRLHLSRSVSLEYYEGGHTFFTNPKALKKFKNDLVEFYKRKR